MEESSGILMYVNTYYVCGCLYKYAFTYRHVRKIRAPAGMFDLGVWFGGMDRGFGSGYGSGVWIAARKTFISRTGRELSLEPKLYRPVHYQLS